MKKHMLTNCFSWAIKNIVTFVSENLKKYTMASRKLTKKEDAIMDIFWDNGALFIKELRELYPEQKPHVKK